MLSATSLLMAAFAGAAAMAFMRAGMDAYRAERREPEHVFDGRRTPWMVSFIASTIAGLILLCMALLCAARIGAAP